MIYLYRLLFLPLLCIALPRYLSRMIRRGGYMAMMKGRLGLGRHLGIPLPGTRRIWVHAVSVGELMAIDPVIRDLAAREGTEIVLTVTTSTAYALAKSKLANVCVDIRPFPLDFWLFSAMAWRRIRPNFCLMMEGELWPEHIHQAHSRSVPVLVANARLSDRSWRRYRRFMGPARCLLFRKVSLILAGNRQDAERFRALGLCNVRYSGQLKCDVPVEPRLSAEEKAALRAKLFPGLSAETLVLLGSSTWPGEEEFLLSLLGEMRRGRDVRLLLVPRHAERGGEIAKLLEASGLPWHWRSKGGEVPAGTIVHLADTTGELRILTQAANLALIGKSLPPNTEGQSPIEAAALGVPCVMGPGMANFRDLSRAMAESGAAFRTADAGQAREKLLLLAADETLRRTTGAKAAEWFLSQRGARRVTIESVETLYNLPSPLTLP